MKTLLILCFLLSGCAYKGDVLIYSPRGSSNAIEKTVDADSNVGLK